MNYKNFKTINLEEIKNQEKITVVKFSEFGFPLVLNLKLEEIKLKNWAQYDNCLSIQGRLPRKRKSNVFLIRPYEDFVIYAGTITKDEFNDFKKVISKTNEVTVTNWGTCFSDGAIDEYTNIDKEYLCSSKDLAN